MIPTIASTTRIAVMIFCFRAGSLSYIAVRVFMNRIIVSLTAFGLLSVVGFLQSIVICRDNQGSSKPPPEPFRPPERGRLIEHSSRRKNALVIPTGIPFIMGTATCAA